MEKNVPRECVRIPSYIYTHKHTHTYTARIDCTMRNVSLIARAETHTNWRNGITFMETISLEVFLFVFFLYIFFVCFRHIAIVWEFPSFFPIFLLSCSLSLSLPGCAYHIQSCMWLWPFGLLLLLFTPVLRIPMFAHYNGIKSFFSTIHSPFGVRLLTWALSIMVDGLFGWRVQISANLHFSRKRCICAWLARAYLSHKHTFLLL